MSASSATGTSTRRDRRYSPRLLAWGSGRVDEATPSPSSPWTTKLRASRFGELVAVDLERGGFGEQLAEARHRELGRQPGEPGRAARPQAHVGVAPLVARAGPDDGARAPAPRVSPPGRRRRARRRGASTAPRRRGPEHSASMRDAAAIDHASAVVVDDGLVDAVRAPRASARTRRRRWPHRVARSGRSPGSWPGPARWRRWRSAAPPPRGRGP